MPRRSPAASRTSRPADRRHAKNRSRSIADEQIAVAAERQAGGDAEFGRVDLRAVVGDQAIHLPSNRLDTYSRPSGPARATSDWRCPPPAARRAPSRAMRYSGTAPCAAAAAHRAIQPPAVERRAVHLMHAGDQRSRATSRYMVRRAARRCGPPDFPRASSGTMMRTQYGDAATTCASCVPTSTCGGPSAGTGRWMPRGRHVPGTAQAGRMAEITCGNDSLRLVVELDVPVHVVAPAVGRVAQTEVSCASSGAPALVRPPRMTDQVHAGLLGRASALPPVAADAARDDVLPVLAAALRDRHDVVERELAEASTSPQYWQEWLSRA